MLEYWNDGIMGSGKMGQWLIGKISLDREANKCVTSFKNQHSNIPPFHYSMRQAKNRGLENLLYFQ
jgi:hypothetical protein